MLKFFMWLLFGLTRQERCARVYSHLACPLWFPASSAVVSFFCHHCYSCYKTTDTQDVGKYFLIDFWFYKLADWHLILALTDSRWRNRFRKFSMRPNNTFFSCERESTVPSWRRGTGVWAWEKRRREGAGEGRKREKRGREAWSIWGRKVGAERKKAIICCWLLGIIQSKTLI